MLINRGYFRGKGKNMFNTINPYSAQVKTAQKVGFNAAKKMSGNDLARKISVIVHPNDAEPGKRGLKMDKIAALLQANGHKELAKSFKEVGENCMHQDSVS